MQRCSLNRLVLFTLFSSLLLFGCANTPSTPKKGAVATTHPLATQAAFRALDRGGNAFDAAVAAAATLAVVEPYSASLGGGSLWLIQSKDDAPVLLDALPTAPRSSFDQVSTEGALSAAIPGHVTALTTVNREFGIMPIAATLRDAIQIAENGFRISRQYINIVQSQRQKLERYGNNHPLFAQSTLQPGNLIKQPQLADTLRAIGSGGANTFYVGPIATQLLADVQTAGGKWATDDLTQYRAMHRTPIRFTYRNAVIHTAPPPSVTGVALQRMLGIVARVEESEHNLLQQTVLNLESMKLAFEDLETYIGDPEINTVSAERLSAPSYLSYLADLTATRVNTANIDDLPTGDVTKPGTQDVLSEHSSHISIIDGDGNRVSVAISLNAPFGSGLVSRQTGIVLNNHLERFTDKQGKTAPRPVPQQRPTTYLAPTFVETADRALAMSTSGGKKTATTLLLGTQNQLNNHAFPDWLAEQRYHRDERTVIQFERHAFSRALLQQLKGQHYQLEELSYDFGNLQAVTWNKRDDTLEAGSDPRGSGQAFVRH